MNEESKTSRIVEPPLPLDPTAPSANAVDPDQPSAGLTAGLGGPQDVPIFPRSRLLRLAEIERRHFWFVSRRFFLDRLLGRHLLDTGQLVLDLGCGTGSTVERLLSRGQRVIGLDRRPEGLLTVRRSRGDARLIRADGSLLPIENGSADAVLLFDVLEHADDRSLLSEVRRVLRPAGIVIATVPAMPWLWSHRDVAAGHLRRYTRGTLIAAFLSEGLAVREIRYFQCLLFPLVAMSRLLGRRGPRARDLEDRPPRLINGALGWINRLEARLGDLVRWPWGSSLAIVGVKP